MVVFTGPVITGRRPVVGVLCSNGSVSGKPSQILANRFIEPIARLAGASVLIIPAMPHAVDPRSMMGVLDGLVLAGCCSNVAPRHYGGRSLPEGQLLDVDRDAIAFRMADAAINAGKPVFGICRGLQELNVLFGGSLDPVAGLRDGMSHFEGEASYDHRHPVDIRSGGILGAHIENASIDPVSVHRQGIDELGGGLFVEAIAPDGLVEAVSSRPNGGIVLGVQWHPELDFGLNAKDRFFDIMGLALAA